MTIRASTEHNIHNFVLMLIVVLSDLMNHSQHHWCIKQGILQIPFFYDDVTFYYEEKHNNMLIMYSLRAVCPDLCCRQPLVTIVTANSRVRPVVLTRIKIFHAERYQNTPLIYN